MVYPLDSVNQVDPRERKLVAVRASYDLILQMMFEGFETRGRIKTVEGLPEGAKLVREYHDAQGSYVTFVFHHESFDEVCPGCMIPIIQVVHHAEYS